MWLSWCSGRTCGWRPEKFSRFWCETLHCPGIRWLSTWRRTIHPTKTRKKLTKYLLLTAMKFVLAIYVCTVYVYANQIQAPKTAVRDIPANVNRNAPNSCFAVTQNKTFEIGQSWSLKPFCGRATCGRVNQGLVERVEDCGIEPKKSPGCTYINQADLQKEFPDCCPKFQCQPGSQLLFPTEQELRAFFEAAQRQQQQQGGQRPPGPQGGRPQGR